MISVLDVGNLSPEERRKHDLESLIFERGVYAQLTSRKPYTAEELHWEFTAQELDFTLEEIQDRINQRGKK